MHLKTKYLESKVDKMMAEMTNVQKMMNLSENDFGDNDSREMDDTDEEQYQEAEDFQSAHLSMNVRPTVYTFC